jgi:hypothetical protein
MIAVRTARPDRSIEEVAAAVRIMVALVAALRAAPDPEAALQSLAQGGDLEIAASIPVRESIRPFTRRHAKRLVALASEAKPAAAIRLQPDAPGLPTRFAGIFLLWRSVTALGLDRLLAASNPHGHAARRMLLAAKLAGGADVRASRDDAGLHLLASGSDDIPLEHLLDVTRMATEQGGAILLDRLRACLPMRGDRRWVALDRRDRADGGVLVFARDCETDDWLWAFDGEAGHAHASTVEWIGRLAAIEPAIAGVVVPPGFDEVRAHRALTQWRPVVDGDLPVLIRPSASIDDAARAAMARRSDPTDRVFADLDFLALPRDGDSVIDARGDLVWSVIARAVYRDLGRRLIGFSGSSVVHLHHNFVAGTGSVRVDTVSGRRVITVVLPAVALRLVLRMAGIDGTRFALPGDDTTEVVLSMPQG